MRAVLRLTLAAGLLIVVACGDDQQPAAEPDSGVTGVVHLGPQCPVQNAQDPYAERAAGGVTVTVSEQIPGDAHVAGKEIARTTTATDGTFTLALAPGEYVVTAEAGMSCELVDAWVTRDTYARVDIPCDTGIR